MVSTSNRQSFVLDMYTRQINLNALFQVRGSLLPYTSPLLRTRRGDVYIVNVSRNLDGRKTSKLDAIKMRLID